MTWVKVCGLTNPEDVATALDAGADAVGFVNVAGSPRYVSLERAAELASGVNRTTVLLTLDLEPGMALDALVRTGISAIQPYGLHQLETAAAALDSGYFVLAPTRPEPGLDLSAVVGVPLLDTPSDTRLGGTGRRFDWALAEHIPEQFVLAGGLGPQNVAEAIVRVRPWGVDASSALEEAPGRKDHGMVADFINKAKTT